MRKANRSFPWKIFYRIAFLQSVLVILACLLSAICARHFYGKFLTRSVQNQMRETLGLVPPTASVNENWCQAFFSRTKYGIDVKTVEGNPVCTFKADPATLILASMDWPEQNLVLTLGFPRAELATFSQGFNGSLGVFLITIVVALLAFSLWISRRLVFPIGRLLIKTQNLVTPSLQSSNRDVDGAFGEWSELESNIDDIRKNLERTAQTLTMEQIELDTVMGAISDAILAIDPEGVPLFYNTRFEVVFGGGGIRRNIKLYEIVRDPDILNAYQRSLEEGKVSITRAFSHESRSGERRYFSLSVSPLRKQGGVIYGALGIFHDITELKTAEQMRIDFVANVSHELRTPLTAIKGYAETMYGDVEKDPHKFEGTSAKDYLSVITRNTTRLMNLMEDLLDLSSIESATLLQRDTLSTEEVTLRVLKQVQPKCDKKRQRIEVEYDAKMVLADPNRLEQVLINLLDNAHKFAPEGGVLKVKWDPDRKGGKDVFLKVSDNGPGIAVDHQRRLFERFYRIDKARSREQGGTGLGLAIVKHIMQRHEGAVWVDSVLGQGAMFICRFPG